MNTLNGNITAIQSHEGISLVKVESNDTIFTSIVLDTPETASYLKTGHSVKIIFKETEVIISKDSSPNISLQNRLDCTIESIKKGVLLSQIN
jgi:molybdate transport system regulatory protein